MSDGEDRDSFREAEATQDHSSWDLLPFRECIRVEPLSLCFGRRHAARCGFCKPRI